MLVSSVCRVFGLVLLKDHIWPGVKDNNGSAQSQVHRKTLCTVSGLPESWDKAWSWILFSCWWSCERGTSSYRTGCVRHAFKDVFWSQCCSGFCFSCKEKRCYSNNKNITTEKFSTTWLGKILTVSEECNGPVKYEAEDTHILKRHF